MGAGRGEGIEREDAEQLVRFLCWRAGVKPPVIDWNGRHTRGQYREGRIAIGPRIRDGLAAVIHEVAHHVRAERVPKLPKGRHGYKGLRGKRVLHGPVFEETLRELAGAWYGDANLYPWETEYRSLRAAGRGRG